jgi:hypothetical protein
MQDEDPAQALQSAVEHRLLAIRCSPLPPTHRPRYHRKNAAKGLNLLVQDCQSDLAAQPVFELAVFAACTAQEGGRAAHCLKHEIDP